MLNLVTFPAMANFQQAAAVAMLSVAHVVLHSSGAAFDAAAAESENDMPAADVKTEV